MSNAALRILLVGAGGLGDAIVKIAARRSFYELIVVSDHDRSRAERVVETVASRHGRDVAARFIAAQIDASDPEQVAAVAREYSVTHVLNAVEPQLVPAVFAGALAAGCDYIDLSMSPSEPHATDPFAQTGVKLGDDQFAQGPDWERAKRIALVGMGAQPGLSDVFARYASDHLFSDIVELGVRDGSNLVVLDAEGHEIFAPAFSIWDTIDECLNPPVIWERNAGWYTTAPFSEPEFFDFPEGIGPVECVNVEHGEVMLMPRWVDAERVTFKHGLGSELLGVLRTLHLLGLDSTTPLTVPGPDGNVTVAPRDVVVAALPDPATSGSRMSGKCCAGVWVTGTGLDGEPREVYLYHVVDNEWSMREYGCQCVVWQAALNPVIALELLASGVWAGVGVLGPEAFDLMARPEADGGFGQAWGMQELLD